MDINKVIVKMGILYNSPCVLFRHKNGFAWNYNGEIKDLGNITEEEAIQKFDWNF
jgi:hypothetical protein